MKDTDITVDQIISESYKTATEKGWWEAGGDRTVGTALMLVTSEIAEAMEEYRNGHPLDEIYYQPSGKPEGFPVELADAIIRIADFCAHHKIPLSRAVLEKLEYNKTREYRHGGKLV